VQGADILLVFPEPFIRSVPDWKGEANRSEQAAKRQKNQQGVSRGFDSRKPPAPKSLAGKHLHNISHKQCIPIGCFLMEHILEQHREQFFHQVFASLDSHGALLS
jgi:hypothetical protein